MTWILVLKFCTGKFKFFFINFLQMIIISINLKKLFNNCFFFFLFSSYELQLEEKARRKGLGKFIMNTLEAIAKENSMKKVVLTTLKKNVDANIFYEKLG